MVAQRQDNTIDMNDVVITIEVGSDVIDKARSAEITHIVWSLPSLRFSSPHQPPIPLLPVSHRAARITVRFSSLSLARIYNI